MNVAPVKERVAASDERAVIDGVRRVVRALRESSRAVEVAVGLSGAQVFVLHALSGARPLSLNEVAARTLTHQSSVSVVVSRLVARGLVRRVRARDDARKLQLALTPKGAAVAARVPFVEQQRMLAGLRKLSPTQVRALARALGAWLEAMGIAEAEPTMFFEEPKRRRAPAKDHAPPVPTAPRAARTARVRRG